MLRTCRAASLLPVLLWGPLVASAAEILTIPQWEVGAGVFDSLTDESDSQISVVVVNPLQIVFDAQLGASTATASLDYAWQPDAGAGTFRLDGVLEAQGSAQRFSSAAGGAVWVQGSVDLILGIDASFSYFMPPGDREAHLNFVVLTVNPSSVVYANEQRALRMIGDPPTGTFMIDDQILLSAGSIFRLRHDMSLINFGGSPDLLSTGNGYINFTLEPVPEPSSACLAACGLALLLRKRRSRASIN